MQSIEPPARPATASQQATVLRPRSDTPNSSHNPRPKSRGSTTSLQSVGVGTSFQPHMDQMPGEHNTAYIQRGGGQAAFPHNPEDALLAHYHSQQMGPHVGVSSYDMRPQSQHAFQDMSQYPVAYGPSNGLAHYPMHTAGMSQQHMHHHMRQHSEHYIEGSPAPDDSNNEAGGAKRRKGTASSLANDQELRRLLEQYQGKSLKEVAAEVQRNEGGGGKSEKAKQVFAMIWLGESCKRSTSSVRRDRVFSRYTERCGNERVPTLNPASFGKLVRIIFPNVQTRRLGVRGESKYHYVDLSLEADDGESYLPTFNQGPVDENPVQQSSSDMANKIHQTHMRSVSVPQTIRQSTETADFPAPTEAYLPRPVEEVSPAVRSQLPAVPTNLDCQYLNTPTIRIPSRGMHPSLVAALPSIRSNLPATLSTYLSMPSSDTRMATAPNSQGSPIELPDIHSYLSGVKYDATIADSLSHLYRSYCIDVIDAFRRCKERSFFKHHSDFNGKMTVPLAKLFALEQLQPWIQECDMRMYKQMVRFLAPLVMQEVPPIVLGMFDQVGNRLVGHLATAFEEKCPAHVVIAKVVPAARFTNLLKKLKHVLAGVVQVVEMLKDDALRKQMWADLLTFVDPEQVVDESLPPPNALEVVEGILTGDMKKLLSPSDDPGLIAAEQEPSYAYASFIRKRNGAPGVMPAEDDEEQASIHEIWVQWLERLPLAFDQHHPQCMMNWHTGFWKSIVTQLGLMGARSYPAWYCMESFMNNMLRWMTQMEGMLLDEAAQKEMEERENLKRHQHDGQAVANSDRQGSVKRKRSASDVGGGERSQSTGRMQEKPPSDHQGTSVAEQQDTKPTLSLGLDGTADTNSHQNDEEDDDMDEIRRSGPLDLPSINTNSSPFKRLSGNHQVHDDSGIDLGLDIEDGSGAEEHIKKKDSWILSDPVDADGHVIVI